MHFRRMHALGRVALGGVLAAVLAFGSLAPAAPGAGASRALADEGDQPLTSYELQQRIEQTQSDYASAQEQAQVAADHVANQEARIKEIESEIPLQQERSASATRDLYKLQQQSGGIVSMLVGAVSFQDLIQQIEYFSRITDANYAEIRRLSDLRSELDATRQQLLESQAEAWARVEEARASLEAAQVAQAEEQRRIEEEARIAAEAAQNARALEEEPRDNAEPTPDDPANTQPPAQTTPDPAPDAGSGTGSGPSAVDPPAGSDETSFVSQWAPRIDAYLAGSPMAGQGETFARAAFTYNVDPRWSPAIACTESGKGAYCFLPHNAWGWGSASWDSWEEAINDHVAGLASIYGYTISVEAAKMYCPPNWEFWYNTTSSQMDLI